MEIAVVNVVHYFFRVNSARLILIMAPSRGYFDLANQDALGFQKLTATERTMMRFYEQRHQYTCGIDLHAKTMYLCILDREGQKLFHRNLPTCERRVKNAARVGGLKVGLKV